jgi:hypothetical protein
MSMTDPIEQSRKTLRAHMVWRGGVGASAEAAILAHEQAIIRSHPDVLRLASTARAMAQLAEDIGAHIDDVGGSGGDTVRGIAASLHAALAPWEEPK